MIKLQDHFLLTRRTEPVGLMRILSHFSLHSLQASRKTHNVHLWYVPRFELLQNRMDTKDPAPSSIGVEASDSRSEVVQFTPRRAAETKVRVTYFGWWKGMRRDPWLLPLLEPVALSSLCDRHMPRKRLRLSNRWLCKRPSRFETRSCFQAYQVVIAMLRQGVFQGESEKWDLKSGS